MLDLLGEFVAELRAAGIPVSTTEHLDAARALVAIDLLDRPVMKAALAATMVKDEAHYPVFDTAFEIYFAMIDAAATDADGELDALEEASREQGRAEGQRGRGRSQGRGGGASGDVSAEELAAMLVRALRERDDALLADVARQSQSTATRAWSRAGPSVARTTCTARCGTSTSTGSSGCSSRRRPDRVPSRRARSQSASRATRRQHASSSLKRAVEAEIRRRLVEDRGAGGPCPFRAQAAARGHRRDARDARRAGRSSTAPLSRSAARWRSGSPASGARGTADRWTCAARSAHRMSTGRRPHHSSVQAAASREAGDLRHRRRVGLRRELREVHARCWCTRSRSQFRKVRSFVFVDGLDEATRFFEEPVGPRGRGQPHQHRGRRRLDRRPLRLRPGAHACSTSATPRTSRGERACSCSATRATTTTPRRPGSSTDLRARARAVYWLNPEPRATGTRATRSSRHYAPYCDDVVECRTLRQLEHFVGALA